MSTTPEDDLQAKVDAFRAKLRGDLGDAYQESPAARADVAGATAQSPKASKASKDPKAEKAPKATKPPKAAKSDTAPQEQQAPAATTADQAPSEAKAPKPEKEGPSIFARVGGWIVLAAQTSWSWLKEQFAKIKAAFTSKSDKKSDSEGSSSKRGSFSFAKHKTSIILGGVGIVVLGLVIFSFARFQVVTVAQGIETTLGASEERTVLIAKASEAERNDLIVAVLPGSGVEGKEVLILGSVFSENGETYAVYDGEVIWQIPLSDLRGMVMFASATEAP